MHRIHNQPSDGPFGDVLQEAITNKFSELIIISAFAKTTGVLAIKNRMIEFKKCGGKISAYIGIDLNGTSAEALTLLRELTDHLIICHDRRPNVIFHPKMYVLKNNERAWVAIGSNNLTHNGLYNNVECASVMNLDLSLKEDQNILDSVFKMLENFHKSNHFCIEADETVIDDLLKNGYISKEIDIIRNKSKPQTTPDDFSELFGTIVSCSKNTEIQPVESKVPKDKKTKLASASRFWIQTGKMTGGSGNQLDLSKTGIVLMGDATNTPYALDDGYMMGSVSFFGVDPNQTSATKDVIISLDGVDYVGNTIKIETEGNNPNGSWRIQLKGTSPLTGKPIHKQANLVYKILLFQEIYDGYYLLTILDSDDETMIENASIVVAANGNRASNRKYGVLNLDSEEFF